MRREALRVKAQIAVIARDNPSAHITYLAARVVRARDAAVFLSIIVSFIIDVCCCCLTLPRFIGLFARAVAKLHITKPRR